LTNNTLLPGIFFAVYMINGHYPNRVLNYIDTVTLFVENNFLLA